MHFKYGSFRVQRQYSCPFAAVSSVKHLKPHQFGVRVMEKGNHCTSMLSPDGFSGVEEVVATSMNGPASSDSSDNPINSLLEAAGALDSGIEPQEDQEGSLEVDKDEDGLVAILSEMTFKVSDATGGDPSVPTKCSVGARVALQKIGHNPLLLKFIREYVGDFAKLLSDNLTEMDVEVDDDGDVRKKPCECHECGVNMYLKELRLLTKKVSYCSEHSQFICIDCSNYTNNDQRERRGRSDERDQNTCLLCVHWLCNECDPEECTEEEHFVCKECIIHITRCRQLQ